MAVSYRNTPVLTLLRSVIRAKQRIEELAHANIARYGLAPGEFDVVMTLGNTDGLRMCDLAARTLTTPPNVTRLVKSLEQKGYVERRRNPESDREVITTLTAKGEALFEEAYPATYEYWKDHFGGIFSNAELKELSALLSRIADHEPEGCRPGRADTSR